MQVETTDIVYQYAAATLWLTYGLAIAISAACVLVGTAVVLSQHASYSSQFSTVLRVAQGAHFDGHIAPEDRGGQDPLPKYLRTMVLQFPTDDPVEPVVSESGDRDAGDDPGGRATSRLMKHVL